MTIVDGSKEYSFATTRHAAVRRRGDRAAGRVVAPAARDEQRDGREGEGGAGQGERILCRAVTRPIVIACLARGRACSPAAAGRSRVPESDRPRITAPSCSTSAAPAATRSPRRTPTDPSRPASCQGGERTNGPNFDVRKVSARGRPLRDPQRRLLRRDHAGQRRDRAGRRRGGRLPRQVLGQAQTASNVAPGEGSRCSTSRQIRRDPEPARAALERRGDGPGAARRGARARRAPPRAAARARGAAARARTRRASGSASCSAAGEDASEAIAEVRGVLEREKGLEDELREVEEQLHRAAGRAAEPARPDRAATRTRCCARSARRARPAATTWSCSASYVDMEARRARVGLALRLPEGAAGLLELALVQLGARLLEGKGFSR